MKINSVLLVMACALIAGCTTTRSISNSSYRDGSASYPPRPEVSDPAFAYRGELSEFDVLGITRGETASESEIQRALDSAKAVKLRPNSSILLIQSGTLFPDGGMVTQVSKHFRVVPFTGIPPISHRDGAQQKTESRDPQSFARSLRLTAARGGNDIILCYWGVLESETKNLMTKTVSWVPVVSWVVPDEKQHIRIRLKIAVVDVRSGNWSVFSPEPFDDSSISTRHWRGVADQKQVDQLKEKAYEAGVKSLLALYADSSLRPALADR
jgi:hypothetical protein